MDATSQPNAGLYIRYDFKLERHDWNLDLIITNRWIAN